MLEVNNIVNFQGKILRVVAIDYQQNWVLLRTLDNSLKIEDNIYVSIGNRFLEKMTLKDVLKYNVKENIRKNDLNDYINMIENKIYELSLKGKTCIELQVDDEYVKYMDLIEQYFKDIEFSVEQKIVPSYGFAIKW